MSYIGNEPFSVAFLTDTFSGNGSTTTFTLSAAPAGTSSILVAISGVVQDPSTYSVVGTTLTFSPAPPTGTGNISVRFLGIPASGVTTTAYRTVTEFTATAGQTTFSVPSYTPGFIDVYRNGVMLGSADYTASNGVSVVLASGATAGDLVEVISMQVSSVLNAIPATAGSVGSSNIASGVTINFADGSASTPSITNDGDTNTGIFFPAADTIAFAEGGAEVARFDSNGNLGIGTSSPSLTNFDANTRGVEVKASTTYGGVRIGGATGELYLASGGGAAWVWNRENSPMIFATNGADRMRIDSSGNLLVGTTTSEGRITITGDACGGYIGAITNANLSNCNPAHGLIFRAGFNGSASGSNYFSFRRPDNTVTGSITQTGSTTVSFTTSSDYRLKENIAPMTGALAKVALLKPCTYTWKEDGSDGQGFIAHELQEVVPDCVVGEKDAVDFEGNPQYQGIDTSFLVATLTAAIQELKAEVDSLKAEVTALKGTA